MSATFSEATGRPYGIQRVCQAWERSRSALYARQTREQQRHKGEEPARRGPTPTVSDATLLEADSGRSRPLAVPGRGPSEGPRAAADLGQVRVVPGRRQCRHVEKPPRPRPAALAEAAALPGWRPPWRRGGRVPASGSAAPPR